MAMSNGGDERTNAGDSDGGNDHQLRVSKIRSGTVIDHVRGGQALNVLAILGIDGSEGEELSVGMNVPSDRLARKDIVKVEGRELSQDEVDVLSLIAPDATINIVRDYEVIEKHRVDRPEIVEDVLSCPNAGCITTGDEPVTSQFEVLDDGVRCAYCGTIVREEIASLIDT
ncbi:aspartate carbamoyltransferase regulatory subunit [Natronorubrum tibetense]|uniref:Aspartate carbamoyltransferase regulatory chain n=1 Tax=Natronorubrum tibetense GA33 TaxID=1114856 RepID=L9VMT9_9EURY|nr:aspartate carbamoyltransferase regulatory subunit [Natronorubrum tibetense]ELY38474.1 aspartate carbamoyltransferase regulatory subunit [Natronorubrum tibetense GA33]